MSKEPTRCQLLLAFRRAGGRSDLDLAMNWPALRIALTNTATVMANKPLKKSHLGDFKRAAAGDSD